MTSAELIRLAHNLFDKPFSIETQPILPDESAAYEWTGATARVTTPKGVYTAWVHGDLEDYGRLEEEALVAALVRSGVFEGGVGASSLVENKEEVGAETAPQAEEPVQEAPEAPEAQVPQTTFHLSMDVDSGETTYLCSDCNQVITEYEAGTSIMSPQEVAKKTQERHGRALCASCSVKTLGKRRRRA